MKYKVIACGVFEPYLNHLADECPNEIIIRALDAGLHSRPNDLRLLAQAEIDEASREGGYDAVIMFYGLCGRGTANLLSRDIPVVIPRAHDCITLFLGSAEAYLREFNKNPGTFTWHIEIPANTTATVCIPAADAKSVTEGGKAVGVADGIKFVGMESDRAVFEVGSGRYALVSKLVPGKA